jgi:hypothetical protein
LSWLRKNTDTIASRVIAGAILGVLGFLGIVGWRWLFG